MPKISHNLYLTTSLLLTSSQGGKSSLADAPDPPTSAPSFVPATGACASSVSIPELTSILARFGTTGSNISLRFLHAKYVVYTNKNIKSDMLT